MCDLVNTYNIDDGIPQPDDTAVEQKYVYEGRQMTIAICSDTDLGTKLRPDKAQAASYAKSTVHLPLTSKHGANDV